jgi:hypothetical protein
MTNNHSTFFLTILAGGALVLADPARSESPIDNPIDTVNRHMEIATADFGNGVVQMHSRRDSASEIQHTVYTFDCTNRTYANVFADGLAPPAFPVNSSTVMTNTIEEDGPIAPLAQHACSKHGLKLEW